MRPPSPAQRHIVAARLIETERAVGSSPDNAAVMIILTVILPPTLQADFVSPALRQCAMTAAGTRIQLLPGRSEDVSLIRVRLEPGCPLRH